MSYTPEAMALRRCKARCADGSPCHAFACWDDPRGLCASHGRHHRGPMAKQPTPSKHARYVPCTCVAYAFPHRPGAGVCRWPDEPRFEELGPEGQRRAVVASMEALRGHAARVVGHASPTDDAHEDAEFEVGVMLEFREAIARRSAGGRASSPT